MLIINFIKNFSITKFLIFSFGLILVYIIGAMFLMVNRQAQFMPIDLQILTEINEHKVLMNGENLIMFKNLSRFDQSASLIITNQRLLTLKNWQAESINLNEIIQVIVTSMFLGFSIVHIQTKDHFFEVEIENANLDKVIQALQIDPKNVIYKNYADKKAS